MAFRINFFNPWGTPSGYYYRFERKLQNSNCDEQMREEILRISAGISKEIEHSFCRSEVYSRYETVIENLVSSEEPELNEVMEELQQMLQEFNEKRINEIESVVWRKVFKTLSQRNSETKICDLLDVFEFIQVKDKLEWDTSLFSSPCENADHLKPVYEMWGQKILQRAETMNFMEIKESLDDLSREIEKANVQKSIDKIESRVWRKIFKKLYKRIPESKITELLDTFEDIKIELDESRSFSKFELVEDFVHPYEKLGRDMLKHAETMDFMKIKESLRDLLRKMTIPRDDSTLLDVTIEEIDGTQRILEGVRKTDSVDTLISKVEDTYRIPKHKFVLTHDGNFLKPGQSLANLNIHDGLHVQLFRVKVKKHLLVLT